MKELVAYSFQAERDPGSKYPTMETIHSEVDGWLRSKGAESPGSGQIVLRGGRPAELKRSYKQSQLGTISSFILTEPTPAGWFRTTIETAENQAHIGVSVLLEAGSSSLTPVDVDVRCPRIIRSLLALPVSWRYGGSEVRTKAIPLSGFAGGDEFINLVWDSSRTLPVIAISEDQGFVLHPGIIEDLAADLAGLALVASLDTEASWRLTSRKEKLWSCYGGAIRLYWPNLTDRSSPFTAAPLWTPRKLLENVSDTESAATRIRDQFRRKIFSQAALAVTEPAFLGFIRQQARHEELESLRLKAEQSPYDRALAEEYFNKAIELTEIINQRDEEIVDLKRMVASLQTALRYRDESPDIVQPVEETPPETVEDAYILAMDRYKSELVFGNAVEAGIQDVVPEAGPPDKVLAYLDTLAELTRVRRRGPLGKTAIKWLLERGINCSGESDTIRACKAEQKLRTWDNGFGDPVCFDQHLKPTDGTSPDRCIRIYFEYDEKRTVTCIGWIGRKPGL